MTKEEYSKAIVTIDKGVLCNLPIAEYTGKIVLVDKPEKVEEAIEALKKAPIIGFDTETRPSFRKGLTYKVALIQLSTDNCCYLFRTNEIGYPDDLKELLEDPNKLKVGLSLHDDFHNLRKVMEIEPAGFIDLQNFVKNYKIADNSLSKLYGILFKERISKAQRLSNWEAPELTQAQQIYAAMDAYACVRIYKYLKGGKFDPGQSEFLLIPVEEKQTNDEENEN